MFIYDSNDKNMPTNIDDYNEAVASQEEAYLEEAEEQVRTILESDAPRPQLNENSDRQREQAAEELITGDPDDPPMSEEAVTKLLSR